MRRVEAWLSGQDSELSLGFFSDALYHQLDDALALRIEIDEQPADSAFLVVYPATFEVALELMHVVDA